MPKGTAEHAGRSGEDAGSGGRECLDYGCAELAAGPALGG